MKDRISIFRSALLVVLILLSAPAAAQYRIVVPFAPGGFTDLFARLLAQSMTPSLGIPVVIENKPGAGGAIGIQAIGSSAADGRTFGVITAGSVISTLLGGTGSLNQVRGVSVLGISGMLIAVPATQNIQNIGGLLALGRTKHLAVGTSGSGTLSDICARQFAAAANMQSPQIVPYKGVAPMLQDLISGQLDMACVPGGTLTDNRSVRILATTLPYPHPSAPTAPTLESVGVKGVIIGDWIMMVASNAANPGNLGNWVSALSRTLAEPGFITKQQSNGIDTIPSDDVNPDIAEAFLRRQIGVLTPIVAAIPR